MTCSLPNAAHRPTKISQEEVEKKPWKYLGYQAFSQWAASDNDFFVIRRFGALNTRVILKWQDDIAKLEDELQSLDDDARRIDGPHLNNGSFRHEPIPRRSEILHESHRKLKEYSALSPTGAAAHMFREALT
ncbi:hypothetical protein FGG08_000536 [Glutinoglossum americanum]|uniref:DUF6594 domain-containing protein n=1 Tax=Glutinoglossum americanum TaxID=1670608 RepID=A0A9P8ICT3_9PEZI|nr:hypothetical protein FGG08_000536 [Glutinoglossum americanum]